MQQPVESSDEHDHKSRRLTAHIGAVVIGRNEGARLERSCSSVLMLLPRVVYSDSGSTDGSARVAHGLGLAVVELEPNGTPTAARARNAGFEALMRAFPDTGCVQFVDGDTVLDPEWIDHARDFLEAHPRASIVCGRLHERGAKDNVFRRLLDMEWDRELGEVRACGGIFLARASDFLGVGGFDASVACGEEADLCRRVRSKGGTVHRLARSMGVHDSGMDTAKAWWKRSIRNGRGQAAARRRSVSGDHLAEVRRFWSSIGWAVLELVAAGALLAFFLAGTALAGWIALAVASVLTLQGLRIALRERAKWGFRSATLYAAACLSAKLPEAIGGLLPARGEPAQGPRAADAPSRG